MSETPRTFKDVVKRREVLPPLAVDDYLAEIDALIDAHNYFRQDRVIPAIGAGTASVDVVRRVALEFYYLGKWMTPEFAMLIASAPDVYAFTMEDSTHYHHWAQNFADEAGYLGDPNHVQMKVDQCRQLGLRDDDIRSYTPLAETIAMTFTMLFYVRRSYEEGLAVFGYAGERVAAGSGYARTMFEGLRDHYGVTVKNFEVHAYAEPDHGKRAGDLFRLVAVSRAVQERCREAIRNYLLAAEVRVRAMNRWVG
jgi:pyrroloquinoline quinone (PQQ) biosynthesis protein C